MADAIITWRDGRHSTVYDVKELPHLRRSAGGMGWLYFNPNTSRYEQYRSIEFIPDDAKEKMSVRSASIGSKKPREEPKKKLPAHLRLHQIYSL